MRGLKTYFGSLAPRLPRDVYVLEAGGSRYQRKMVLLK
jgi:hypothetical protein